MNNMPQKIMLVSLCLVIMGGYFFAFHMLSETARILPETVAKEYSSGSQADGQQNQQTSGTSSSSGQAGADAGTADKADEQAQGTGQPATGGEEEGKTEEQLAAEAHRAKLERFRKTPRLLNNQIFLMENLAGLNISGSSISGTRFNNCALNDFYASKASFSNCVFTDTDFSKAHLRDSVFENCTFENVNMDEVRFYDIRFVNCKFISTKREQGFSKGRIALAQMHNVTYEKSEFEDYEFFQLNGRVYFTKSQMDGIDFSVDGDSKFYNSLGSYKQLSLILKDCTGGGFTLESRRADSDIRIEDCNFTNAKIYGFKRVQVKGGSLAQETHIMSDEWLVVQNADVCAKLSSEGTMYFIDNNFVREIIPKSSYSLWKDEDAGYRYTQLSPKQGATIYIDGGKKDSAFTLYGGVAYINDLDVSMAFFDLDNSGEPVQLNMKNVSIDSGYMYNTSIDRAYWENVTIKQTMPLRKLQLDRNFTPKPIYFHKIILPENGRWLDGNYYKLVETIKEKWPKPEAPSLP